MASGGQLSITKFALSDDEIDYDLWNPAHTLGTNYYGAVIENMPILEALPDESQMLRYKLVTLPKDVTGIPVISVTPSSITFTSLEQASTVTPATLNLPGGNSTLGYTVILSDDTVASIEVAPDGAVSSAPTVGTSLSAANFLTDQTTSVTTAGKTVVRIGTKFIVKAKPQVGLKIQRALLTIIGNETGGFKTISITVDPRDMNTPPVTQLVDNGGFLG